MNNIFDLEKGLNETTNNLLSNSTVFGQSLSLSQ